MLNMTPGPTAVHEDVRMRLSLDYPNTDLDDSFVDFYQQLSRKIAGILNTTNDVIIMCGEGMIALEAACVSLIEKGDRVLCIDNGIFGNGFKELIELAGGKAVMFSGDYDKPIDVEKLEEFFKEDSNFKVATLVHCETPTGLTNPVERICPILNKYGIISIVDSVSAIGGEEINADRNKIDVVLGASQKCLSAPTGLSFLSVSQAAWDKMTGRYNPIPSYYLNLLNYKDSVKNRWFPYTMPGALLFALDTAVDRLIGETEFVKRHERIAKAVRAALSQAGLELFCKEGHSNTVTAFYVPKDTDYGQIYKDMLNLDVMIAGSLGEFKNRLIRIGHMGENCSVEKVAVALAALDRVLRNKGVISGDLLNHIFAKELI